MQGVLATEGRLITRPPTWNPGRWDLVRAGRMSWRIDPTWQEALLGAEGLRWEAWRAEGRVRTIKTGPHRVVWRVELPQGAVYVKHFLVPDYRSKTRQWVRRGKGHNEAKRAAALWSIGIRTITPVALGEHRTWGMLLDNILITEEISGMMPLDEFVERKLPALPKWEQAEKHRRMAHALAVLTARMHDAGLVHEDFHPGNVLIRWDHDEPFLAMIDLDALRVYRKVELSQVRRNLAKLDHYFWIRSDRTDRYRFLRIYLQSRQDSIPVDPHTLCREIERETRYWAERLWTRWGARCQKDNKYFHTKSGAGTYACASRVLPPELLTTLLADPSAPMRPENHAIILKDSRTATVAVTELPLADGPVPVIYKQFHNKKWLDPVLALVRPTRAQRAWQAAQHLAARAIPTPRNLAIVTEKGFLGFPKTQFLIVEKAEPSINLADYLREVLPHADPIQQRERINALTIALARLIRTLHDRSLSDRDLKAANILIVGDSCANPLELTLIDLVGVQLRHPLPQNRRIQNLARLQLSLAEAPGRTRTDSLRFLRDYLPWGLRSRNEWKSLWRLIDQRCQDKIAQNQRHGRILS